MRKAYLLLTVPFLSRFIFAQIPGTQERPAPPTETKTLAADDPSVTIERNVHLTMPYFSSGNLVPAGRPAAKKGESLGMTEMASFGIGDILNPKALVKDILGGFQDTANQMLFSAQNSGSALLSQTGVEVNVATENVGILLGDKINQTLDRLDPQERALIEQIHDMVNTANNLPSQVAHVADLLQLDLTQITNQIPFTNKRTFYVSTISGLTQIHSGTDYKVSITGLGFGYNDNSNSYQVTVKLGDSVLAPNSYQRPNAHELDLSLPHDLVDSYFTDTKIGYIPIHLSSVISHSRFLLGSQQKKYDVNITLVALPKQSATFILTEPVAGLPHLDGKTITDSVTRSMPKGTCSSDHNCSWNQDYSVANNQRIVGVRYSCQGQCRWCYNARPNHGLPDYDLLNNDTKATVYVNCVGDAQDTTVTHYFDFQTEVTDTSTFPHPSQGVAFGQTTKVDLSPGNATCSYNVTGTLITGQVIAEDSNSATSNASLLQATGAPVRFGDHCQVTFTLRMP